MDFAAGQPINKLIVYIVIIVYFAVVLGFGGFFGRHTKSTKDFFFSGQRFSWWLIAFSCVATVVGSYSFIKYSAAGFRYGTSSTMTYLNDWFLAPLFILGWMPLIYYARVTSIPEYFEKRFDRPTRVMSVVFIMLYMIGYIGINLYTMGVAVNAIAPLDNLITRVYPAAAEMVNPDGIAYATQLSRFSWAAMIAVVAAIYVTFGGQTAVIMTDLLQGILLLIAGLVLFYLGIHFLGLNNPDAVGGLAAFWQGLPETHQLPFSGFTRPEKFPMVGIFWQDFFGSSMFFYFANQGLIMRFLAVKSVNEGRKAIIAVILVLMPLAAIAVANAGWMGKAMQTYGMIPEGVDANDIFVVVAGKIVANPVIFGLILAALTAALMSTVDTLINAVSAIAVNDVWKPFVATGRDDKHYLRMARVFSAAFTGAGLLLVPLYMQFNSIYVAHGTFTAAISPPIIVVVILGITWKRFSARSAFLTLVIGGALMLLSLKWTGVIKPLADLHGMDPGTGYNYMRALYGFLLCSILAVTTTLIWPNRDEEKIKGLWVGTLQIAKRLFKGSEPNDLDLGEKVRVTLEAGSEAVDEAGAMVTAIVAMAKDEADRMKAESGDLVYVADKRWWLGGLKSLHATLKVGDADRGKIIVPGNYIEDSRLNVGEEVVVEKII
jgi:SSS family solute:Na+ symporter